MTRFIKVVVGLVPFVFVVAISPKAFTESDCAWQVLVNRTECGKSDLTAKQLRECEVHFEHIMEGCGAYDERQSYYRMYYEEKCQKSDVCSPTCKIVRGHLPDASKLGGKCD
jgi:hypothetical protein